MTPTPSLHGDETPGDEMKVTEEEMKVTDVGDNEEVMEVEEVGPDLSQLTLGQTGLLMFLSEERVQQSHTLNL